MRHDNSGVQQDALFSGKVPPSLKKVPEGGGAFLSKSSCVRRGWRWGWMWCRLWSRFQRFLAQGIGYIDPEGEFSRRECWCFTGFGDSQKKRLCFNRIGSINYLNWGNLISTDLPRHHSIAEEPNTFLIHNQVLRFAKHPEMQTWLIGRCHDLRMTCCSYGHKKFQSISRLGSTT